MFKKIQALLIYLFVFIAIFCILMPVLLPDPIANLVAAIKTMAHYPHDSISLFLGQWITSSEIPRSFLPVWMAVTTPIFYIVLFLAGLCGFFAAIRKNLVTFYKENKYLVVALLWFFIPVLGQIVLKSNIYNGWRHMYFVYPALLIIAVNGIKWIYDLLKKTNLKYYSVSAAIAAIIIMLNLGFISFEMIRMHPYEYVYFNIFAGKDLGVVEKRFTIDFWGMSYKYGLEYILKNDDRKKITYTTASGSADKKIYLFPKSDRDRLVSAGPADAIIILIITDMGAKKRVDVKKIYTIFVNGGSLISIYKNLAISSNIIFDLDTSSKSTDILSGFELTNASGVLELSTNGNHSKSLKSFQVPIKIKKGTDYLITFEIKQDIKMDNSVFFDFFGKEYDNPQQEFNLKPDSIKSDEFMQVGKVINSGSLKDQY